MNGETKTLDAHARVCAYLRTSKGDSTSERQLLSITAWCERRRLTLAHTFVDEGGRRHEAGAAKRPAFNGMIEEIRRGSWDLVLVDESTRFGTAKVRELQYYLHILDEGGAALWEMTKDRSLSGGDIGSVILTDIASHSSRQEVETLATRTLSEKVRDSRYGFYQGGPTPCGMALHGKD